MEARLEELQDKVVVCENSIYEKYWKLREIKHGNIFNINLVWLYYRFFLPCDIFVKQRTSGRSVIKAIANVWLFFLNIHKVMQNFSKVLKQTNRHDFSQKVRQPTEWMELLQRTCDPVFRLHKASAFSPLTARFGLKQTYMSLSLHWLSSIPPRLSKGHVYT